MKVSLGGWAFRERIIIVKKRLFRSLMSLLNRDEQLLGFVNSLMASNKKSELKDWMMMMLAKTWIRWIMIKVLRLAGDSLSIVSSFVTMNSANCTIICKPDFRLLSEHASRFFSPEFRVAIDAHAARLSSRLRRAVWTSHSLQFKFFERFFGGDLMKIK